MPAINRTPLNRLSLNQHTHISRASISRHYSSYRRTDFNSQTGSFTSSYETGTPTRGPLSESSTHGVPRLTPSLLKAHLDKYVVGQDRAKKITSVAIYNHYQRIREVRRQEQEDDERQEQRARWENRESARNAHSMESKFVYFYNEQNRMESREKNRGLLAELDALELRMRTDEYTGHIETVDLNAHLRNSMDEEPELGSKPLDDGVPHTVIEKSNLMLLGPSGVGKTYILSTLARILEVPFTTIDCSSLTQAGYIGTDIESSLERLLSASSSLTACQHGIIFFDEVDKLAKPAIMTHGRDVSGEGVQQGLLKMIEGSMVTINSKNEKSSRSERLERGTNGRERANDGKSEQVTIDTSNILFVFAGAFVGLERIIASRLSTGSSLGFGAQLKSPSLSSSTSTKSTTSSKTKSKKTKEPNILANVQPSDLQTYGLIPELLGRIPLLCELSPLSLSDLVSILTSPRNSLVAQYTALFSTYGITLKFTTAALHAIASRALPPSPGSTSKVAAGAGGGIGARGLRSIMEQVLAEVMFVGPGSAIRYCLVDGEFVKSLFGENKDGEGKVGEVNGEEDDGEETKMPRCWSRGQSRTFEDEFEKAEKWKEEHDEKGEDRGETTFEKLRSVGSSGM